MSDTHMAGSTAPAPSSGTPSSEVAGGWLVRACAAGRFAPLGVWIAATALYLLFLFAFNGISGDLDKWQRPDGAWDIGRLLVESVNGILLGYAIAAHGLARVRALDDLAALTPVLDCPPRDRKALAVALRHPPAWTHVLAVAFALLGGYAIVNLEPRVWGGVPRPEFPDPYYLWVYFRNASLGWATTRLFLEDVRVTRVFARAARHARVDLLDPRPLDPFLLKGQRSLLIWIVFLSIFSLFWVHGSAAWTNKFLVVLVTGLAAAAFLLPLGRLRSHIRDQKHAELDRVNQAIRGERELVLDSAKREPSQRLADLIAYRGLVEAVHEWPLSAPALLRFGFFVLLGLGSWLGAALVERLLESVLG